MSVTLFRVNGLNSERLELYNLTEFVDFYIKFIIIVSTCYFLSTFFRFAFYVKLVVHWMTTTANKNDVHCFVSLKFK